MCLKIRVNHTPRMHIPHEAWRKVFSKGPRTEGPPHADAPFDMPHNNTGPYSTKDSKYKGPKQQHININISHPGSKSKARYKGDRHHGLREPSVYAIYHILYYIPYIIVRYYLLYTIYYIAYWDPYVYVVFWSPSIELTETTLAPGCDSRRHPSVAFGWSAAPARRAPAVRPALL